MQAEIDSGRAAGGGSEDIAIVDIEHIGIDRDARMPFAQQFGVARQCVEARFPSRRPAAAGTKTPEQRVAMRAPRPTASRNASCQSLCTAHPRHASRGHDKAGFGQHFSAACAATAEPARRAHRPFADGGGREPIPAAPLVPPRETEDLVGDAEFESAKAVIDERGDQGSVRFGRWVCMI